MFREVISHESRKSGRIRLTKCLCMDKLKQLAAHGACARLAELRAEMTAILRAFPEVARPSGGIGPIRGRKRRGGVAAAPATSAPRRRRRRGKLSAAGRARFSRAKKKRGAAGKEKNPRRTPE